MEEYYKIMHSLRNIELIFEHSKDTANDTFPTLLSNALGGKKQIRQCIKEILASCDEAEKIIPIGITNPIKQDIIQLHSDISQIHDDMLSQSQLEDFLEHCYKIRKTLEKLKLQFQPIQKWNEAQTLCQSTLIPKETLLLTPQETKTLPSLTDYLGFVLFVEPEEDMRSHVRKILTDDKWYVKTASNPETALKIIQEEIPDLILSAINMSGMDGFEFVKFLRSMKNTSHLPIIFLTARAEEEDRVKGLQLGAEDYITKPFSPKELCIRVRVHCELSRLRIQFAQTAENREQLLDNLCHELRNPLQGIYGNIQFLQDSLHEIEKLMNSFGVTSDQLDSISITLKGKLLSHLAIIQEALESIHYCAKHQKSVTEDMLQLSKLDAKKVELNVSTMNPKIVIQQVVSMLSSEIQRKKIHLSISVSDSIHVQGDGHRLAQILLNLITNSLKFTTEGGSILIKANIVETNEKQTFLEFSVEDNGIGMTEDELKRLFSRFSQANRKTYQEYGGIGLGLQISKKLIELMGGKIEVESKPQQGSIFRFTIHCQPLPTSSVQYNDSDSSLSSMNENKKESKKDHPLHVLIVEDNIINQKLLLKQLKKEGYSCSVANNGQDALTKLEEKHSKKIDIILMDMEMPIMNGLEATREIRSRENINHWTPIPIIGVSGNATDKHKKEAIAAGMNAYVTKPYTIKKLKNIIRQNINPLIKNQSYIDSLPSPPLLTTSINVTKPLAIKPSPPGQCRSLNKTTKIKSSPKKKVRSSNIPLRLFSTTIQATISPDRIYRTLSTTEEIASTPQPSKRVLSTTTQVLDKMIQAATVSSQSTSLSPLHKNNDSKPLFHSRLMRSLLAQEAETILPNIIEQLYITYPIHLKNYDTLRKTYLKMCATYYKRLELVTPHELITKKDILNMKDLLKQLQQPASFSHTQYPRLSTLSPIEEIPLNSSTLKTHP